MAPVRLEPGDALIIVDPQVDFFPGGKVPVPEGDEIIGPLNRWIRTARNAERPILVTRDWHPANHISFKERGGPWPAHCVQGSEGAQFHPHLELPPEVEVISKGEHPDHEQYSAFQRPHLAGELWDQGLRRLWVGGLAQDICVRATVLDALEAGFDVFVLKAAMRPVNLQAGDGERALRTMEEAGATIVTDVPD